MLVNNILISRLKRFGICASVYGLLWMPLYPVIAQAATVSALAASSSVSAPTCADPGSGNSQTADTSDGDQFEGDSGVGPYTYVGINDLKATPSFNFMLDQRISTLTALGQYDQASGKYKVCNTNGNLAQIFSILPISTQTTTLFNALQVVTPKITFKNPQDEWALTGEPCRKYLSDGTCDETLGKDGNPLYYDDIYWQTPDGKHHWDAPKADSRVLQALVYLVTPIDQGGAGHEYVQVGKIIQDSQKDKDFTDANLTADQVAAAEQDISSHYYDHDNPEHPTRIAQSMELSQIDQIRMTTRITEKHRIGGDSKKYQYKSFPINVAWQSDQGIAQTPLPQMTDLYSGSLQSVTGSFGQLLDSLDLEASVDPSSVNINSLSSLTQYIGDSLLTSLLQGGNLKGFDLGSTLDGFGRSYLALKLGLPKTALSRGDTVEEVIRNIGQSVAEQNLGLPVGSLDGGSSAEIYRNMGAKFFENVFKVAPGTLTAGTVSNQDQLLQALGRGRIEQQYGLKRGSLASVSDSGQLLKMNFKTQQLFTDKYANLVDDDLALTYAASPLTQKYNLKESSFDNTTLRLVKGQLDLHSYEQLVGVRAWDTTMGQFSASPPPNNTGSAQASHFSACALNPSSGNDGGPDIGTCIADVSGSGLAPFVLQKFGVNLSSLANRVSTVNYQVGGLLNTLLKDGRAIPSPNPDANQIIGQAMSSPLAQQLVDTKAMTADQLKTFLSGATSVVIGATSKPFVPMTTSQQAAQAPAQLQLDGAFKSILDSALLPLNAQQLAAGSDDSALPSSDSLYAFNAISAMAQMNASDISHWTDVLSSQNQSAQSAALDLPGPLPQVSATGQISNQPLLTTDPVTALGLGDLSGLGAVGKLVLAKKLSSDKLSQFSFASQLQTDLSPSFGKISSTLSPLLDTSKLQGYGFTGDDFSKIFQKDLSPQVFSRVGQQALLKAVWNISGAASQVNAAVNGSAALQQVASTLDTINNDVTFYVSHWQQLQSVVRQLSQQPSNLIPDSLKGQIQQYGGDHTGTQAITDGSNNLQTLINQVNAQTDTLRSLISEANLLINEIAAGHDLSLSQAPGTSAISVSASGCWSQLLLRNDLLNGKAKMQDVTVGIGACQLESTLNLPVGSILTFYQKVKAGGGATLADFEWSVGKADFGQNNYPTYDEAVTRGKQVLERKGISTLVQQIPGVSSALGKFGLTADSIFGLIQGQSEPVSVTLGGYTLDTKLQLPGGTMQNVAQPDCGQTPCTTEGAKDSRLRSLAKAGMKQLATALQMPASLDITGHGDFATNYGKSYVSENLGLATNSFEGPFSQLLSKNALETVLSSFGLGQTVYDTDLQGIESNLRQAYTKYASDSGATSSISAMTGEIDNRIKGDQTALIAAMQDGNSMLYYPDPTPASYQAFGAPFAKGYADTLKTINSYANQDEIKQIVKPYLDQLGSAADFSAQIGAYQQRLSGLDKSYSLQPGTFAKYVLGRIDASVINQAVGSNQAGNKLQNDAISKLLGNNSNPILQDVVNGLPALTKSDSCPNGVTVGDLLLGTNRYSGCQASSIGHIDLNLLLSGSDPNSKQARGFLYDSLLARSFGAKLEDTMKLPAGTIRNFALNPRQAPEVALTTGLNMVADQLFKTSSKDSDFGAEAKGALRNAFMQGFYDVSTNTYTYDFNSKRSLDSLNQVLPKMEQQELNTYSKQYLGTTITLGDLHGITSGDPTALLYVGLQRFAFSTNQALAQQAGSDPRATPFQINYADIRNAISYGPPTPQEGDAAKYQGAISYLSTDYRNHPDDFNCDKNTTLCNKLDSLNPADVQGNVALVNSISDQAKTTGDPALQNVALSLNSAGETSYENFDKTRKKIAQQNLQYRMYDIAAFEIDKNIPVGFARAMLEGNSAERSNLVGQFAFNALRIKDSSLGAFINASEFGSLIQFVQSNYRDTSNLTQGAMDGLNAWATDQFQKKFNINLPPGTMAGIIGWASTGFSSSQFSSAKITQGPLACGNAGSGCKFTAVAPIGSVLKEWGEAKLFAWGDKALGFNVGGTYRIYKAVDTYVKTARAATAAASAAKSAESAYKAAKAAKDASLIASTAVTSIKTAEVADAANKANKQGEAAAISEVINVVFAKQIGQAETQLGLVPGTGALAVNILVDLIMGNPMAIVDIAMFIGMNLFGVYKTVVDTSATADGYYPYKGNFGDSGLADGDNGDTYQAPSPGYQIGEFNPRDDNAYHNGVKQAAQAKIQNVLSDLLLFPVTWGAAQGIDPKKLYVSQVFTLRQEDLQQMDYLISQPSPRDNPAGLGYGPLSERTSKVAYDDTKKQWTADPNGVRFGYFFSPLFWNQIHVRW